MKRLLYILLGVAASTATLFAQDDIISEKPVHYINLSPKIGYSAGFDNLGKLVDANGTPLAQSKPFGGGGAGLGLEYELELGRFLFNVGLDFDFQHNMTDYNLAFDRTAMAPYADYTYHYRFMGYRENRNYLHAGLPIRLGAQFGNFYFLVGAKVGYNLKMSYNSLATGPSHYYQVTATDPLQPNTEIGPNASLGTGLYNIANGQEGFNGPLSLKAFNAFPEGLDIRALLEMGIDLDEWLQAPPPKKKPKIRKGQKYMPFTKNDIHYRLGFFAECGGYSVLPSNTSNIMSFGTTTATIADEAVQPTAANTVLALQPSASADKSSMLHNLFVGAKFTVQFAMPEKVKKKGGGKGQSVPPSILKVKVLDKDSHEPLPQAFVSIRNLKSGKISLRGKEVRKGEHIQRFSRGNYALWFTHPNYYTSDTIQYASVNPGSTDSAVVYLAKRPVLKVKVVNAETGNPMLATVSIHHDYFQQPLALTTDENSGATETMLEDGDGYILSVDVKGFEPYKEKIKSIGDDVVVKLTPIKVGKTFVLKNMFFATNKTKILEESEPALQMLYEYMIDEMNAGRRIKIVGHTDSVGKDAANMKLSDGRANAVRQALIDRGIEGSRIEAEGRGETEPIDTNDTEEGRQNNRRVEIVVLE